MSWSSVHYPEKFRQRNFCNHKNCNTKISLKTDSLLPKNIFYFLQWKPFKDAEKYILFHLKSSLRAKGIDIFVLTFWSCRENGVIRKICLSKFMTWQAASQTVTIHILRIISGCKGNQTMKFGKVIECNKKSISLQKSSRKWCSKTSSKSLFFKKEFYKVKANFLQLSFNIFWWSFTWHTIKARCVKT